MDTNLCHILELLLIIADKAADISIHQCRFLVPYENRSKFYTKFQLHQAESYVFLFQLQCHLSYYFFFFWGGGGL